VEKRHPDLIEKLNQGTLNWDRNSQTTRSSTRPLFYFYKWNTNCLFGNQPCLKTS